MEADFIVGTPQVTTQPLTH